MREAFLKQKDDTIQYAHTAAVTAGEVLNLAGVGVIIALDTASANETATYQRKGIFQLPIGAGVTVVQGNRCYWDVSENAIILTGMAAGDFELGRAVADGSAVAGYVDVEIGGSTADYRTSGGLTAAKVAAIVGQRTVVGTELLETLTNAVFETTDNIFANFESVATSSTSRITKIDKSTAGTLIFNFSSISTGSLLNYMVMK